jgi:spermidine/putrescine transport system substrate-binding protein
MADSERTQLEIAIERALRIDRLSRRRFLRQGTIFAGSVLSLPAILAACSPSSSGDVTLEWANWPAYIDIDEENPPDPTAYPTINAFIAATSIGVNYTEAILGNSEFYANIQPDLAAGNETGWDVITPGGWVIQRMADLGYLEELDHSKLPNWTANCGDWAKGQWFDEGNTHSLWWQGGITGIGYDPNLTGREIKSFEDLLDPAFAGHVGGFSDMRDMFGLTLLSLGITPESATVSDVEQAQAILLAANERGQFRDYYDNSYYDELANGNLWLGVAWSGDVTQMALYDNADIKFVIPEEGGMRWNDNLAIPKGAPHLDESLQLLDYWYSLDAATILSEYIGYFTGVAGVKERILADAAAEEDPEVATQLEVTGNSVEPTQDQLANTYVDRQLTEDEEAAWNDLFDAVIN